MSSRKSWLRGSSFVTVSDPTSFCLFWTTSRSSLFPQPSVPRKKNCSDDAIWGRMSFITFTVCSSCSAVITRGDHRFFWRLSKIWTKSHEACHPKIWTKSREPCHPKSEQNHVNHVIQNLRKRHQNLNKAYLKILIAILPSRWLGDSELQRLLWKWNHAKFGNRFRESPSKSHCKIMPQTAGQTWSR